jgi:hypothetical protein
VTARKYYNQFTLGMLHYYGEGGLVEDITKPLRPIGWLQRRVLIAHNSVLGPATMKAMASLKAMMKPCGCTCLLPPKDMERRCGACRAFLGPQEAAKRRTIGSVTPWQPIVLMRGAFTLRREYT